MNNNFFEMCLSVFKQNLHLQELKEDVDDYNRAEEYLNYFNQIRREDIENFILSVRAKSPIRKVRELISNIRSSNQNVKFLWQLDPLELYSTLKAEQNDIVYKGVLDAIKFLNGLNEQQTEDVAQRLVNGDVSIFGTYRTKL